MLVGVAGAVYYLARQQTTKNLAWKILFGLWGGFGFLFNLFNLIDVFSFNAGVELSTRVSAVALIWIGGMLFFGLGAIVFRGWVWRRAARPVVGPTAPGAPEMPGPV